MISSQFKALALSACVMLSACGGGGDGDDGETVSAKPCAGTTTAKVQLYGDSTQEGFVGASGTLAVNTPTVALQAAADARYGAGRLSVTSRARTGSTSQGLLAGTDDRNFAWPDPVDADVVVMNHGRNDRVHFGLERLPEYAPTLQKLIDLTPKGTVMIFETPNWAGAYDLAPYAAVMRQVAANNGVAVADVFAYTEALPDRVAQIPDLAHPSDALYKAFVTGVVAPAVFKVTDQILCR